MKRETIARRFNCKPVIGWKEDGSDTQEFISIGEAARTAGICNAAVRKALNDGHKTFNGWFFDYGTQHLPAEAPKRAVRLTFDEIRELYHLLRFDIVRAAQKGPYKKNYSWPLFDSVADALKRTGYQATDSHHIYEYEFEWLDKNRDDIEADR